MSSGHRRDQANLEVRFAWLSHAAVAVVGAAFVAGLAMHVLSPGIWSRQLLEAGVLLLMVAPAIRLFVAVAEQIRRGDWTFAVMTLVVAAELGIVMWRASQRL